MDLIEQALQSPVYLVLIVFIGGLYWVAYRSSIYYVFDPIVPLLLNFTFSGAFVVWMGASGIIRSDYLWVYIACSIAFTFGFWLGRARWRWGDRPNGNGGDSARRHTKYTLPGRLDRTHLYYFALLLGLLNFATLVYAFQNSALAILADDPVVDRVAINAANRWVSVIMTASGSVGLLVSVLLIFLSRKRWRKLMSATLAATFLLNFLSAGSKSAIWTLVFTLGGLIVYLRINRFAVPRWVYTLNYAFIPLGLAYFILVTSLPGLDSRSWPVRLVMRLAGSGDAYIFFFVADQYERLRGAYNIVTYLLHSFTAGLGIKLIPYNIGTALYGNVTGDYSGIGPNPQHVVEAIVLFGMFFAPVYSFALGWLTAFARRVFMRKSGNSGLICFLVAFITASTIPVDITLWLFYVLAPFAILPVPYFAGKLLARMQRRRPIRKLVVATV